MSDQSKATSMADLMAKHQSSLQTLQKGQVIRGKVTKIQNGEILLDANAKTEAVVMEKDRKLLKQLLSLLHVGDTVDATVIYPESEMGYPVVSLRRYVEGKIWEDLAHLQKSGEKVAVLVTESTKGGLLVEADNGVSGFLPNSHIAAGKNAQELVGQKIQASIVELSQESKKVVFSQKGVLSEDDFKKIMAKYKPGTKVRGIVSGITSFGVFVSLPFEKRGEEEVFVDGLIHISEVSWEKVDDLSERYAMGDEVEVVVLGADRDSKRIDLSVKKLSSDPFQAVLESFPIDKKVSGIVSDVNENGVVLDLGTVGETQVEGMIKKDKIPPTTKYEVGETVKATVTAIDAKRRKVMLTPILLEKPLMYR
ncbi:MAG TPA: S1 RNA-binding domain-containing protein [Candidatus Saccharimonadales bacterium]|nr:S1 RNA-binding domain-containing protein [Candidatus Saccharimonadales bacterium]